ncbi:type 4b pilus protein PilO2 [Cupriavidus sp. D39]|uniref:type 4b pilus protein PilO2 n=1 Tax=Cupriavidus sp. D39 TaxID=2997877 RepID=UPI002271D7E0|nr:type 4b pilus protein PilO2 [Cupriavidus sp. D39]MCY0853024.1 type 4b pilus protein PilO2 [Cupriavidus sp. D39]
MKFPSRRRRPPEKKAVAASESSEIAIITIHGKKFVSGLFWQPLSRARAYMGEARELGKKHDWDIVAIRRGRARIQAGFVSKDRGALKGMYSLAASLAGVLGDRWIGAFAVDDQDRYAVVAVHEGTIVPGFDRVVHGFEEAKQLLMHGINLLDFGENVFAPQAFGVALQEHDLPSVLKPKLLRPEYKLKQLTFGLTKKEIGVLAVALLIAGVGIFAYGKWAEHQEAQRIAELQRQAELRRRALALLEEQSRKKQTVKALEHPWAHMPSALAFTSACKEASAATPLSIAGWVERDSSCVAGSVVVAYVRGQKGATVEAFHDAASSLKDWRVAVLDSSIEATITRDLSMPAAGDELLLDASAAKMRLASEVQGWGEDVAKLVSIVHRDISVPKPPPALPGQVTPAAPLPPEPTWQEFTFEFKTGLPPARHVERLKDLPGLRLTNITATLSQEEAKLEWTVKGDLYANR